MSTEHIPPTNITSTVERMQCDVLLFIATSTEKEQLKKVAKELNFQFNRKKGDLCNYYDLGRVGNYRVMAVKTEMGPLSYDGSAARAINAMAETSATSLILLGMAFGINRDMQELGSLLVSKILLPYDNREVLTIDGRMHVDYTGVVAHQSKESLIKILEKESELPEWNGIITFGALLTGAAKIRCTEYRNELVKSLSSRGEMVVGGEMEGVGLLSTCDRSFPTWVVVKGISDYADENRERDIEIGREKACKNAARFVLQALSKVEHE